MKFQTTQLDGILSSFKSAINSYVEPPINPGISGFIGMMPTASGISINVENMLQSSAVSSCLRIIIDDIGKLDINLEIKNKRGGWVVDETPDTLRLLRYPNQENVMQTLLKALVFDYLTYGNAYVVCIRNPDGSTQKLVHVKANGVTVRRNEKGELRYTASSKMFIGERTSVRSEGPEQETRSISNEDMIHIKDFSVYGGAVGTSIVDYAREVFGLTIAAQETAARTFNNGGALQGYWKTTNAKAGKKTTENVQADLQNIIGGVSNSGKISVINDMDYVPTSMSPQALQLIEARNQMTLEIARLFRVPLHKLGMSETDKAANIEQQEISYINDTLKAITNNIESCFNRKILLERDIGIKRFKFDFESMTCPDLQTRSLAYTTLVDHGLMTPGFAANKLGIPVPEDEEYADSYRVPLNMGTIGANEDIPLSLQTPEPEKKVRKRTQKKEA
ncbi:phage portal protein, HK97 family [Gluconacetobacter diazotrophicus PA1 5]|uniref:phage portal protein n=1 Tax=Gluconacetobacter diazotrophicus TaxID=33996 RepID=UPI000181EFAF|nr:phage portal protein [Gluconacetobacter diazotrophicus]ACI50349.1 phage portal protein, HK97 family [Gluconacetobacter diazotrophicus PA1 5]